jgi:hypothetical protein
MGFAWVTGTRNDRHKNGNAWENPYTIIKIVVFGHFKVKYLQEKLLSNV